jgi:hypothetical protein
MARALIVETRIAVSPAFPDQRRFPEGRNFKQWTGDDSKALMKVQYVHFSVVLKVNDDLPGVFACN